MPDAEGSLLHRASRAAVWNALLLPILAAGNLALSVIIRRTFGLGSGTYDVVLGLTSALLIYSSLGIPTSLSKFLPEIVGLTDFPTLRRFLAQACAARITLVLALLVPLNLLAGQLVNTFDLGADGILYIRLLSVLVVARAAHELATKTLNAFFAQVWSNLFALGQAALDVVLVAGSLFLGYGLAGVLAGLAISSSVVALAAAGYVVVRLEMLSHRDLADSASAAVDASPTDAAPGRRWLAGHGGRFFRFSLFTYALGLMGFFQSMGFVAPALALTLTTEEVALFATAFKLTFMTMTLVIAGFRGLYQPILARLRARNDPAQLQRAFTVLTKSQVVVLIPAGCGLGVMTGDYIPLLFGSAFEPAVPVAQILAAAMFSSVILNVPGIMLTVDERYLPVFWLQAIPVVTAPLFLVAGAYSGLLAAAAVLGLARVLAAVATYMVCRQRYGLRFPWAFTSRVALVSVVMAIVVTLARMNWATSAIEATVVTGLGIVVFTLGLRLARVLGPDEIDLLRRSRAPGHSWILSLLAPRA